MTLKSLSLLAASALCATSAYAGIFDTTAPSRVSVHDPSVVIGYSKDGAITGVDSEGAEKVYYIFGSHRAFAKSNDLQNWTTFRNNISTSYASIFAEDAKWSALGGNQDNESGYNVSGNLWAPDVIWNPKMNKWCMYMSVNGDYWYSSIVLLTAESLDGDWTRVAPVVYSGFTSTEQAKQTDYFTVCPGDTELPARYSLARNGTHIYGLNAIDPCATFDNEGNMWLVYGSWFGGLYMIRLDPETGLRDYSYTYETNDGTAAGATSDQYQGLKLAGGNGCSGEAPYIEYIGDRYFLFVTYGGLTANGGYNMRVFSSDKITGPYTDLAGHPAIWTSNNSGAGNVSGYIGSRLMSYYKWDDQNFGYVAQGHNSAVVDTDGKVFAVYHTRFTNAGEGHEVRVHQLFNVGGGALVAAPFEYSGETLADGPYPSDKVAGKYRMINHVATDFANLVCRTEANLELLADGTVSGTLSGTWKQDADKPYITITAAGIERRGVLLEQKMEGLNATTMCLSIIGKNDTPIWAYKDVSDLALEEATLTLPFGNDHLLETFPTSTEFAAATPRPEITEETGLSLSFFVHGLTSDWQEVAHSTDNNYKLYLSVLHYAGCDFYEAAATPNPENPVGDLWTAFLNRQCTATVSFNPDGTIAYYRDGKLVMTYAADLAPSYGTGTTPAEITKAVIDYYRAGKLRFNAKTYNVAVGYSADFDTASAATISADKESAPAYDLQGRPATPSTRGIIVTPGRKHLR